jgi:tetratricopeptide (TPR) repeat protein
MTKKLSLIALFTFLIFSKNILASAVEEADKLIAKGQYKQAFALLEPLEFDLSGDEKFDLLFGFVALELGHTSLSTLALERVLAVNPNNSTARYHLARAYYVLSDFDGARREFEMLLSMNPTLNVRESIGQFLDAISAREPKAKTNTSGYVSLGYGYDSNVNGATATNPIFIPISGSPITFGSADIETGDQYTSFVGGINTVHKLSDTDSVYIGADINYKGHDAREDLDYTLASLRFGFQSVNGNQSARAGFNTSHMRLDDDSYRNENGVDIEWRNTLKKRTQIGVVAGHSQFRHLTPGNDVQDYNNNQLKFNALHVVGEKGSHLISGSITAGQESAKGLRDDGDNDYYRFSVIGQAKFSENNSGFLLLSLTEKDYEKLNITFLTKRSESLNSAVAGLVFGISKTLSVRPTLSWASQDSNIPLYTYDRLDLSVSLRKDFL